MYPKVQALKVHILRKIPQALLITYLVYINPNKLNGLMSFLYQIRDSK